MILKRLESLEDNYYYSSQSSNSIIINNKLDLRKRNINSLFNNYTQQLENSNENVQDNIEPEDLSQVFSYTPSLDNSENSLSPRTFLKLKEFAR